MTISGLLTYPLSVGFFHVVARYRNDLLPASLFLLGVHYLVILAVLARTSDRFKIRFPALLLTAAVCLLPLFLLPRLFSKDIVNYVSFARIAADHGANPYVRTIAEFRWDPRIRPSFWQDYPAPYGPAWILYSMVVTTIANATEKFLSAVALFKISAAGLHLLNGWLVWNVQAREAHRERVLSTGLYLLSPLALIEFGMNGHNDVLMITFILAAFLVGRNDRWWPIAFSSLVVAALIKIYTLPLVVLYGIGAVRETRDWPVRLTSPVAMATIFGLVCFVFYWKFWAGTAVFVHSFSSNQGLINSLARVIVNHDIRLPAIVPTNSPATVVKTYALIVTAVACAAGAVYSRDARSSRIAMTWYAFAWCAVGATWFFPWYVTFLVALAAVSPSRGARRAGVVFSLSVLTYYVIVESSLPAWMKLVALDAGWLWGPPMVVATAGAIVALRRRAKGPVLV